jgi:hypothetical protein
MINKVGPRPIFKIILIWAYYSSIDAAREEESNGEFGENRA